jgi:hypothetical protein
MRKTISIILLAISSTGIAAPTDIIVNDTGGAIGLANGTYEQSFTATAQNVVAGPQLKTLGTISSAFPILSPIGVTVKLYAGEGVSGALLDSTVVTMTASTTTPSIGYADVDYYAKGIKLVVGNKYTLQFYTTDYIPNQSPGSPVGWWVGQNHSSLGQSDPNACKLINSTAITGGTTANPTIAYAGGQWVPLNSSTVPADPVAYTVPGSYPGGNPGMWGVMYNNDYGCDKGLVSPGDVPMHVIDQTPPAVLPSCSGTSAIVQSTSVSKLFFSLANGQKVQYSNVYGSPGTTVFTYNGGLTAANAFNVGNVVTYNGLLDASSVCVPSSLSFNVASVTPPPPPLPTCVSPQVLSGNICITPTPVISCTKPAGATSASGQALITAVGINTITVGTKVITVPKCAAITYKGHATSFGLGYKTEYKGYTLNGITYATSLIVDDLK